MRQLASWLLLWLAVIMLVAAIPATAKSFYYDRYDVTIAINRDSTVSITEQLGYVFSGEYSTVYRGIPLTNPYAASRCGPSGNATCGGFEYIVVEELLDNYGQKVSPDKYEIGIEEREDEGSFYVIRWKFGPKTFSGDKSFPVTIKYKVYGSLGYIGEDPYFYWNVLPRERGGLVRSAKVVIKLPAGTAQREYLTVYGESRYETKLRGSDITLSLGELAASSDLTVSYNLSQSGITRPAELIVRGDPLGQHLYIDGIAFGKTDFVAHSFPAGEHHVRSVFPGYQPLERTITLSPGDKQELNLVLTPEPLTKLLIYLDYLLLACGCVLIPTAIASVYLVWRRRGRDQARRTTIVPEFGPPSGVRPYMAGSLVDEYVDQRDLIASIIDLAYHGYLGIKELEPAKNYELTRTAKDSTELTPVEQQLLRALFGTKTVTTTKKLAGKFATEFPILQAQIYRQMVEAGYFTISPRRTRGSYLGCGIVLAILGAVLGVTLMVLGISVLGKIGPFTLGLAILGGGLALAIIARFMPAKTESGSETARQLAGFKMYLTTADQFRLRELGPAEFEKNLGFAIAFQVEEQWAERFKEIYRQVPEWYQGSGSPDLFTSYYLTRSLHSFTANMQTVVFTPITTASKGSGWSGGGSFGGFSGGGGGGGFSGAS